MRTFFMGVTAALMLSSPALALDQAPVTLCDQYATSMADKATAGDMQRASDFDQSRPGKVLIIGAGQKFYVPAHTTKAEGVAPKSAWQNMRDYQDAYSEARWRCLTGDGSVFVLRK